jgi:hypothetical protein
MLDFEEILRTSLSTAENGTDGTIDHEESDEEAEFSTVTGTYRTRRRYGKPKPAGRFLSHFPVVSRVVMLMCVKNQMPTTWPRRHRRFHYEMQTQL